MTLLGWSFLLCADPTDFVVLDCTDMVSGEYFAADAPITDEARNAVTAHPRVTEKVLVLTEGCTDTRLLQEAFRSLFRTCAISWRSWTTSNFQSRAAQAIY
jgi:hypothetical protein